MKKILVSLPLLAAIGVVGYGAMHPPGPAEAMFAPPASGALLQVQALPEGHPPLEPWMLELPEGHPPVMQLNPHLPEGHPPIPGSMAECPGIRRGLGGHTDQPAVDTPELIST
jgi:hypothetical protein